MKKNAVNGKNIQPSDEEIIAFLNDWLNNSLFTHTNKKIAVQELIKRYIQSKLTIGRIQGIIKKQQKEIQQLRNKLEFDYVEAHYIDKDKIREKIKELEKESFKSVAISLKINVLKELLEGE